jgi:hypothetical protein
MSVNCEVRCRIAMYRGVCSDSHIVLLGTSVYDSSSTRVYWSSLRWRGWLEHSCREKESATAPSIIGRMERSGAGIRIRKCQHRPADDRMQTTNPIGANSCPPADVFVRHASILIHRTRTNNSSCMASTGDSMQAAAYGLACEACARMKCKCVQLPSSQDGRCER